MRTTAVLLSATLGATLVFGGGVASAAAPAGFTPLSTTWTSVSEGYLVGDTPCGQSQPCTTLLHTTDAAGTWQPVPVPNLNRADNQYRSDPLLAVESAKRFLVHDLNRVLETRDGGRSWAQLEFDTRAPHTEVQSVAYWRGQVYAVLGTPERVDLFTGRPGTRLTPVPGVGLARPANQVASNLAAGDTLQVSLTNHADGWPPSTWRAEAGTGFVQQPYPCLGRELPFYAPHRPGQPTVLLCHSTSPSGQPGHWSKVLATAPAQGGKVTRANPADDLGVAGTFSVVTDKLALVVASGGGVTIMHRTEDLGRTWTRSFVLDEGFPVRDMTFVNHTTGYLTNGPNLYRSTDAGVSWQRVPIG